MRAYHDVMRKKKDAAYLARCASQTANEKFLGNMGIAWLS